MVEARKLQKRMRSISKSKVVKKKIHVRGMRFATVNGDCCWEVRRSYHGGETKELWRAHTYYTPWSIRAISLIKCWSYVFCKISFCFKYPLFLGCYVSFNIYSCSIHQDLRKIMILYRIISITSVKLTLINKVWLSWYR